MPEYFPHDYSARNDIKLKKLLMKHGVAGLGLYWCIVEMLYEAGGDLPDEAITVISFDLRVDPEFINSVIDDFGLFARDGDRFSSPGVTRRLDERASKSDAARKSAQARWQKNGHNANAMRTQYERIACGIAGGTTGSISDSTASGISEADGADCVCNATGMLKRKEKKKKEEEKKEKIYCAFFDFVWSLYPCKRGKSSVSKKAMKELEDAGEETVVAAVERYIATKPDWQNWMNGSTFFNGRWKDYIPEQEEKGAKNSDNDDWESY